MVKIIANKKGEDVDMLLELDGEADTVAIEAAEIMKRLPRQVESASKAAFFLFLAILTGSDMYDVSIKRGDSDAK